jgi:peptidoglycan hydrolase-like protein with peptidoglycan-binding domain
MAPTRDRYKQIQEALASKGFLAPAEATGQWTASSIDALKRFQANQNLEATGKINSLSLIALGLGPKHETAAPRAPTP